MYLQPHHPTPAPSPHHGHHTPNAHHPNKHGHHAPVHHHTPTKPAHPAHHKHAHKPKHASAPRFVMTLDPESVRRVMEWAEANPFSAEALYRKRLSKPDA